MNQVESIAEKKASPPNELPGLTEQVAQNIKHPKKARRIRKADPSQWEAKEGWKRLNYDRRICDSAFRVWHFLYGHADNDGKTRGKFAARWFIAQTFECSERSVDRWTEELQRADWLDLERPNRRGGLVYHTLNGRGLPAKGNMYQPQLFRGMVATFRPPREDTQVASIETRGDTAVASKQARPDTAVASLGNKEIGKREVPSTGVYLVQRSRELEEIERKLDKLSESYDSHSEWSKDDRDYKRRLLARKSELRQELGYVEIPRKVANG